MRATFAAGCFRTVEAAFRRVPGVSSITTGYMGGTQAHPAPRDVNAGMTDHAQVVHLDFDPQVVSFAELLHVFWECHDPTTLNRQGLDIGPQYRSAVFFHTPEQHQTAIASKAARDRSGRHARPTVTRIEPATEFWPASMSEVCESDTRASRCGVD